ncbi:MAG TPA: hypothetical protein VKC11_13820 [Steroidobacteraceae bacterium]|nr:hypothetical protein [Steroidobacteraceae bacterium]
MAKRPFHRRVGLLLGLGALLAVTLGAVSAATLEEETSVRLNQLRAIKAGQSAAVNDSYNRQMDAAWQFFTANQTQVLPILRRQLKAEIAQGRPSDLILLDVGYFVHEHDEGDGKALARDALFRLDPRASIVAFNWQELFEFAHAAAEDHDPRVLDLIGSAFLRSDQKVFIPQHALELNGTLVCVFLYGAYGADAERALSSKLQDRSVAKRTLEILGWLGSPDSVTAVSAALSASPNYETFSRVTSFMMQNAGPTGRAFMLALTPGQLDEESRQYLTKIHATIQDVSFEAIERSFANLPGDKKLSDEETRSRLASMIANFGIDDRTNPLAILDSGLGSDFLIAELLKVRSRTLYRLSDEALSDVEATNAVINGLRYRG